MSNFRDAFFILARRLPHLSPGTALNRCAKWLGVEKHQAAAAVAHDLDLECLDELIAAIEKEGDYS